jgi:plastocyanin
MEVSAPKGEDRAVARARVTHRVRIGLIAALALAIAGCGDDDGNDNGAGDQGATATATKTQTAPAAQQETIPAAVTVSIGDNFYKPKKLAIQVGQTIKWKNAGAVTHTVTSDGDSTVKFDSGNLDPRGIYALKPVTRGELTYHCTIHGKAQSGTVTVER